jgi:hypothetical protein
VLYFLNSETFYWALILVAGLLGLAFGTSLALPTKDRRAGRGGRHRAPGMPRVTPSGTTPRRRNEPFSMPFNVVER